MIVPKMTIRIILKSGTEFSVKCEAKMDLER